ncbi:MAG: primosomal protein N' [bacterium]|nr:primosomal protein N' [bacterium]
MSELIEDIIDDGRETLYVEVVLPLPIPRLFTYRLSEDMNELAVVGKRVFVVFGSRKVYTALIVNITSEAPKVYEAQYVLAFIDDSPLITPQQLKFWQWIADYYMCTLGDVMSAALPSGLKIESETFVALAEDVQYDENELDEKEVKILKLLEGKEKIKISAIETELKSKASFVKIVKSLYDRNLIVISDDITEVFKPKLSTRIKISSVIKEEDFNDLLLASEKKAKKQYEALLALMGQPNADAIKSDLIKKYNLTASAIKALVDKKIIEQYQVTVDRIKLNQNEELSFSLSDEQERALKEVKLSFETKNTTLLHGATASGKTFIYIDLIREAIARGESVLYLVPEIALTEQLIKRLEQYFSDKMAVSHSRFSQFEKVEIWQKANKGEIKLLIGPRSSLFMPLQKLSLIIIDEEHETTFKQTDKAPRYNARDLAMVVAKSNGAKILLGSATPSIETYYNATNGKYGLVKLKSLYGKALQPKIVFADVKEETRTKKMHGIFTDTLFNQLTQLQIEKSQGILFQNRKGYVPVVECTTCGWTSKCVNCDIALTYYKYSNNLKCHYCGYHQPNVTKCQACGSNTMGIQGYGTERIVEELQLLMPELRIIRFDQDSTRQKNAFRNYINDFENGKADVMVGTQIVVKGLDFENVHLAAVINADQLLNFPDFRAYERTFQLLSQLAGRTGRHGKQGFLIIQTRQVQNDILQAVANNDYEGFFQSQLLEREQFSYPPFSRLIKLTLKHKNPEIMNQVSAQFTNLLKQQLGGRILGPETPFVSKIKNFYLRNILVKMEKDKDNEKAIKQFISKTYDYLIQRDNIKGLQMIADVDCY